MSEPAVDPTAAKQEDERLITRVRDGDDEALGALFARYSGPLYALAFQVVRTDRLAQDVVQEAFIALWRQADRFDPARGAVSSWLFALARHKAIDLLRKETTVSRRRAPEEDLASEEAVERVDEEVWLNIRRDRVREALLELPDAQRMCVELAFLHGLTHVEVAERLEIPLGTAKTRIRTGLLRLRLLLGDTVTEDPAADPVAMRGAS